MKIISHRGYWLSPTEKNTITAFERAFELGFGTETDIRDCLGRLVISHDPPFGNAQTLEAFLAGAGKSADENKPLTLALNIKADGLAALLAEQLPRYPQLDCFAFDMAVPDMPQYFALGIPVFARMSEVEQVPSFLDQAAGVWLDAFEREWYSNEVIEDLLRAGKRICIVSSELHGRPNLTQWYQLNNLTQTNQVILCTDKPEEALAYFQGASK